MPKVSEFYGIAIYFYYRDHAPPHFHAVYADAEAMVAIETAEVIAGRLPRHATGLVREWCALHRDDLLAVWQQARQNQALTPIDPLD